MKSYMLMLLFVLMLYIAPLTVYQTVHSQCTNLDVHVYDPNIIFNSLKYKCKVYEETVYVCNAFVEIIGPDDYLIPSKWIETLPPKYKEVYELHLKLHSKAYELMKFYEIKPLSSYIGREDVYIVLTKDEYAKLAKVYRDFRYKLMQGLCREISNREVRARLKLEIWVKPVTYEQFKHCFEIADKLEKQKLIARYSTLSWIDITTHAIQLFLVKPLMDRDNVTIEDIVRVVKRTVGDYPVIITLVKSRAKFIPDVLTEPMYIFTRRTPSNVYTSHLLPRASGSSARVTSSIASPKLFEHSTIVNTSTTALITKASRYVESLDESKDMDRDTLFKALTIALALSIATIFILRVLRR